jgi:hypothetical protein
VQVWVYRATQRMWNRPAFVWLSSSHSINLESANLICQTFSYFLPLVYPRYYLVHLFACPHQTVLSVNSSIALAALTATEWSILPCTYRLLSLSLSLSLSLFFFWLSEGSQIKSNSSCQLCRPRAGWLAAIGTENGRRREREKNCQLKLVGSKLMACELSGPEANQELSKMSTVKQMCVTPGREFRNGHLLLVQVCATVDIYLF